MRTSLGRRPLIATGLAICSRKPERSMIEPSGLLLRKSSDRCSSNQRQSAFLDGVDVTLVELVQDLNVDRNDFGLHGSPLRRT